ncbi:NHLP leader peptide family RiPP precursor [Tenacibaculum ovolyticum]|uniref:NHLP leader peptide family RiPP precursor n=1 Tax=Tenacibaculum ovolyticum TaxID=104270 RepID=UPI0022F3F612|nr:NHLP leader peptide family RiPP precursor [Tenacibaculum ovolyticum]WBX76787.1 NHLP leader peptide family RiPP precursor [Tenacibaculum ovolyticum]
MIQEIVQKAWENADFKKKLIINPKETIETLTGEKLNIPKNKTLIVVDQTDASNLYINIPTKLNLDDLELNEEQLEAVAGGTDRWWLWPLHLVGLAPAANDLLDSIE